MESPTSGDYSYDSTEYTWNQPLYDSFDVFPFSWLGEEESVPPPMMEGGGIYSVDAQTRHRSARKGKGPGFSPVAGFHFQNTKQRWSSQHDRLRFDPQGNMGPPSKTTKRKKNFGITLCSSTFPR